VNGLVRRYRSYVSHGVPRALLVDPDDELVLAFRADGRHLEWHGSDRIDQSEVLPNLHLTVDELFGALRPYGSGDEQWPRPD
jgi:Uma2 family endonuclease